MHDRWERDEGEVSGHANFGGHWARDPHARREGLGDDYARDAGWSGAGRHDQYIRDGEFRGRGPKNWTSDERVRAMLNERLTDHDCIDASDVEVSVANGEVTLGGTCRTRAEKRPRIWPGSAACTTCTTGWSLPPRSEKPASRAGAVPAPFHDRLPAIAVPIPVGAGPATATIEVPIAIEVPVAIEIHPVVVAAAVEATAGTAGPAVAIHPAPPRSAPRL